MTTIHKTHDTHHGQHIDVTFDVDNRHRDYHFEIPNDDRFLQIYYIKQLVSQAKGVNLKITVT